MKHMWLLLKVHIVVCIECRCIIVSATIVSTFRISSYFRRIQGATFTCTPQIFIYARSLQCVFILIGSSNFLNCSRLFPLIFLFLLNRNLALIFFRNTDGHCRGPLLNIVSTVILFAINLGIACTGLLSSIQKLRWFIVNIQRWAIITLFLCLCGVTFFSVATYRTVDFNRLRRLPFMLNLLLWARGNANACYWMYVFVVRTLVVYRLSRFRRLTFIVLWLLCINMLSLIHYIYLILIFKYNKIWIFL